MLSKVKNNALSLATIMMVFAAAVVYLSMGVAVTSGNGWGPSVTHAAVPTPTVSPTPCTPDDPKKPCPTPSPGGTPMPTPSPTMGE